jgi:hypothetical protein
MGGRRGFQLYREIAGVSGLKPDWGSCRFGRRVLSRTVGAHPATRSRFGLGRVPLLLLDTSSSRRRRIGSLQTPACRPMQQRLGRHRRRLLPRIGITSGLLSCCGPRWRVEGVYVLAVGPGRHSGAELYGRDSGRRLMCRRNTRAPAGSNWAEPTPAGGVLGHRVASYRRMQSAVRSMPYRGGRPGIRSALRRSPARLGCRSPPRARRFAPGPTRGGHRRRSAWAVGVARRRRGAACIRARGSRSHWWTGWGWRGLVGDRRSRGR